MTLKDGREYRAVQEFSLAPPEGEAPEYRITGVAAVFNTPTMLFEADGVKYYEIIDSRAFEDSLHGKRAKQGSRSVCTDGR